MNAIKRGLIICVIVGSLFHGGCKSTELTRYTTIAAVMIAVDNSMIAYGEAVEMEIVSDENQYAVRINFERYKVVEKIILQAARYDTQKIAPHDLTTSASDLTYLLTQILTEE